MAVELASKWYRVPADRLSAHLWGESSWGEEGTQPQITGSDGHGQGIAQIDDRFHPFAQDPLGKDVLLQVCYEALLLVGLYRQSGNNWLEASMRYNGDPALQVVQDYGDKIEQFIADKPWLICMRQAWSLA